ncbi:MAG: molecular chaperone GrpE [Blastocatellia bacterium]|jgi:molecular chaperone GrpE|nr:molecular chaperone GrpE [Blastocatellia bacterium]
MASDRKQNQPNSIPINFFDGDDSAASEDDAELRERAETSAAAAEPDSSDPKVNDTGFGGPALAELVASRAELKRLQAALDEAKEALARRQADFENYRKRIERERGEAHLRVVADVARKLLPVVDNLARALDAEKTVQSNESREFRHFLQGVELISKQLNDLLESLGIQPIASVGERFDPHIHEAVVTEPSDNYEPDTVTEELARGYRIGDRLLRPAMVKVAARRDDE